MTWSPQQDAALKAVADWLRRGDRPVFVMREVPLRPGPHRVRLRFAQEGDTGDAAPPALAIDTVVHAAVGIVHLITLDPASARFVIRSASANP